MCIPDARGQVATGGDASLHLAQSGGGGAASVGAITAVIEIGQGVGGGIASGGAVVERGGFVGQVYEVNELSANASPSTVDEGGTRQLTAEAALDDGSLLPLPGSDVLWNVKLGPLAVDGTGLVTAGMVFTDTGSLVEAGYLGVSSEEVALTVLDTDPDFDDDGRSDLLEQAFGTNASEPDAGPLVVTDGTTFAPGDPLMDVSFSPLSVRVRFVERNDGSFTYVPQFTNDLNTWEDGVAIPGFVSGNGGDYDVVEVPYPLFLSNGRKAQFFRIKVIAN